MINNQKLHLIKFKQTDFANLRREILEDLSNEQFAILLGKSEKLCDLNIINVIDIRLLDPSNYLGRSRAHLKIDKDFIREVLVEIQDRFDVDTLIDVHTHPFGAEGVSFSGVDDKDEKDFLKFLTKHFDDLNYASIVFSQTEYSARVWSMNKGKPAYKYALIKTQTAPENIKSTDFKKEGFYDFDSNDLLDKEGYFDRSVLALGLNTMRLMTRNQKITIVGVGGLGSVIAENLVHLGFQQINLIDNDVIELSNLNRIVGAYFSDAQEKTFKVDAIKRHLININPNIEVNAFRNNIYDGEVEKIIATSDWILLATDNHSSRYKTQELSIKYFVPLISVGVNITVRDSEITDMSGEVITARVGDSICLNCLGRINQTKVHFDLLPDEAIKVKLVDRGYISGNDIKEPAVKTLNSFLANIAVETLINQYTLRQQHKPIIVFENNKSMSISEDLCSVRNRNLNCLYCNV